MYVIKERVVALGQDSDITDASGRLVFHVDGKAFSLHDRLIIQEPTGREVAEIRRRLVALTPTYEISRDGEEIAELRTKMLTLFGPRFTLAVAGLGELEVRGDLSAHEFTVRRDDRVVATVSKRWLSISDTYAVDVAPGEDDVLILAGVLAVDLVQDRARAGTGPGR